MAGGGAVCDRGGEMDGGRAPEVQGCRRAPAVVVSATAGGLVARGLWCVVEVRVGDGAWEPRLVICERDVDVVVGVVDGWRAAPGEAVRLAGYTRDTLRRAAFAPPALAC